MTTIPLHYSDHFINQRYNKALYIVQHLPNTSNVQPTKEQKLELYALYKQVTQGNTNIPRPGIFDVVGRAKWDSWKKLENMGQKEAKFRYVEILLKVVTEAYKKPAGRVEAHQIIQSFAAMNPNDSGDSSSEKEETSDDEVIGSSVASEEAEEIAYLREINRSAPTTSRQPEFQQPRSRLEYYHQQQQQQQQQQKLKNIQERSSSRASFQSMKTAPTEFRRLSISSQNSSHINNSTGNRIRPLSVASNVSTNRLLNRSRELYDDSFDDSVNPWILQPTTRQYRADEQDAHIYRSPLSTSSSMTTTQQIVNDRALADMQQTMLGPTTKRALEGLHNEIEALNERINGLRKELIERDQRGRNEVVRKSNKPSSDKDGWKWVFKAAVKHTVINLMTACMLVYLLYKNESPVAHAMLDFVRRFWRNLKLRALISKVVV